MGYSIKQKIDICLMAESHPNMTQIDLATWTKKRYGSAKPPSQTTISRILSKKDELIALKEHEFSLIRRRKLTNPLLRKVLLEWIAQCVWNNIPVTTPIVVSAASSFWNMLPADLREGNGEFSYKWCSQFFSRMNLSLQNLEKELYQNFKVWTFEERTGLKVLLQGIDPKKLFTVDEVLISNDLPLDKAYYDDTSDYVTCMICVNADGSEKMDPLIVGRYENYSPVEGKSHIRTPSSYGVTYHSNRKKWLSSTLFSDWLTVLDKRLELSQKDIILVLDDSSAHRVINTKLQHIKLLFTSCKANFSPMNWGILSDFKLNFRIEQYKKMIERQQLRKGKILTKDELKLTMLDTFELVKRTWDKISPSSIQSAWKQSGMLPKDLSDSFVKVGMFNDKLELILFDVINALKVNEQWDVLSLLDLSVEQQINQTFLSIEELIDCCIVDQWGDECGPTGELKRAPFSTTLGRGFQRLQRFYELQRAANRLGFITDPNIAINAEHFDIDSFQIDDELHNGNYELNYPDMDMSSRSSISNMIDNFNPQITSFNTSELLEGEISSIQKLQVITSFLTLMETDEEFSLSDSAANEIRLLYYQFLNNVREDN